LLSVSPLLAPHHHHPQIHVRAQISDLGLEAMHFGLNNLGNSVTFDSQTGQIVIYNHTKPAPANALYPACANFVWAALQSVGAKTTADFGVVDPPGSTSSNQPSATDYVWGDRVMTFHPGSDDVSSLSAVKPGDVLQFRNVGIWDRGTLVGTITQHTAIVVANLGNGRLQVVQQNFNFQTWVTSDPNLDVHDFNTYGGGTVWVYRPVAK
jgi:hypothetical protein